MYLRLFLLMLLFSLPSFAEACQQYRDVVQDRNGHVIAGTTVTIVYAGTPTIATIYSDSECVVSTPNPLTTGSDGTFSTFLADGEYGVDFAKTGYTFTPIPRLSIYDPLGENIKTVAYFSGNTDLCAAGTGAIDQIGATAITLVINKPVTCSTNKTMPATTKLQFMGSGLITINPGVTLTIDSPAKVFADGNTQVFAGSGTVAFTNGGVAEAMWWCGSGDKEDCLTAALAALPSGILHFVPGTYTYVTSPNFAKASVNIKADQGTLFNHTGSGNAFILDAGTPTGGIFGNTYEYLTIQGNANSTNGLYTRAIHHSRFITPKILGASVTGACIRVDFSVLNQWESPRCSGVEGSISPTPLYGMLLTRRGVGENTTTQQINNMIFESLQNTNGAGLVIDYANNISVTGGTSESNTTGIIITANGAGLNYLMNVDLEGNIVDDMELLGGGANYNTFINLYGLGLTALSGGASRNTFIGGRMDTITLDNTTTYNTFLNVTIPTSLTDNSTVYQENEWINSSQPSFPIVNKFRQAIATAEYGAGQQATIAIDSRLGNTAVTDITTNAAFMLGNPVGIAYRGQRFLWQVRNVSGAPIAVCTFDTLYKVSGACIQPATGYKRYMEFYFDGTNWNEMWRSAADTAN